MSRVQSLHHPGKRAIRIAKRPSCRFVERRPYDLEEAHHEGQESHTNVAKAVDNGFISSPPIEPGPVPFTMH